MGCSESNNLKQSDQHNIVQNKEFIQENSDLQENKNKYRPKKPFDNIGQKHQNIINLAIASALKRLQSQVQTKAEEEQKKIISSINRYYKQNKKKGSYVDSQNMTQSDYETILKILRKHHLFKQLFELMNTQRDFLTKFLLSIKKTAFSFRQYIYKQHDHPTKFYIVAEGKIFIQLNSMSLKPLAINDYFGLQAIIYDSEQGQSAKVRSNKAILYQIDKSEICKIRQKMSMRNKQQIKKLFEEKVVFFNFLDNKQKQRLLSQTVKSTYSKGQIIFEKDYDSNAFFIIQKGYVLIKIPHKKDLILQEGSSFGQSSFYQKKGQRKGTAIAYEDNTVIFAIGSGSIFKSLGNKLDCAVLQNLLKWALYRDPVINEIFFNYNFNMETFIHKFNVKKGQKYEVLAKKNEKAGKVFINIRCEINFMKDLAVLNTKSVKLYIQKYLKLNKQNKSKKSLLTTQDWLENEMNQNSDQQTNELRYEDDIIMTEKGSYSSATVQQLVQLIIQAIQQPQKHKNQVFKIEMSARNIQKYMKLSQKSQKTTILAIQKDFGIEHIIKVYSKNRSNKNNLISSRFIKTLGPISQSKKFKDYQIDFSMIYQQKQIIENLNYPQICGFYKAEEDEDNIYLLFEYIKGITLFEVQLQLGIMPQIVIKFYLLKISLILDYLHKQNIVYRDLKPQNILIDNKGFPNIFDFKTAKKLSINNNFKTSTIIGTPHYLAPQIIQKKLYSFQVDYWQLGIILYELIYQKLPFGDQFEDPIDIFTQILQKQPKLKKQNSCSLLKDLLQKHPSKRIKSFEELVKKSYFQNFEWQDVKNQKMNPPYAPKNISNRFQNVQIFVKNSNK